MPRKPDFGAELDEGAPRTPVIAPDFETAYGALKLPDTRRSIARTPHGLSILDFEASAAGIVIPENASDDQFEQLEDTLFGLENGMQIYIGDYLVAVDNREYGETKAIAERRGRDPDTLYKWKSICKAVTIFLRRKVLVEYPAAKKIPGISHYELIMALPAERQELYLRCVLDDDWSVAKLRAEIAKAQLPAAASDAIGAQDDAPLADSPADDEEEFIPITSEEETTALIDPVIPKQVVKFQKLAQQNRYAEIDTLVIDQIEKWIVSIRKKVKWAKVEADKQARAMKK